MDIFLNYLIQFYSNNTTNLRHLTQRIISSYTNKSGDRIVTIDSVTSLHPMYAQGEMTSYNVWSRYLCQFVGIMSHVVWS